MSTAGASSDKIRATIRRFVEELYNQGYTAIVDEVMAPTFVDHTAMPPITPDRQGLIQDANQMRTAFPDLQVTIDDVLVEGDKAAVLTKMSGTFEAEYNGMPPTHRHATTSGVTFLRFSDGKVTEWWSFGDVLGWLQQLGAFPQPADAAQQPTEAPIEMEMEARA